jgi:hypothetical protein
MEGRMGNISNLPQRKQQQTGVTLLKLVFTKFVHSCILLWCEINKAYQ